MKENEQLRASFQVGKINGEEKSSTIE